MRLFRVEPKDEITSAFTVEEVAHIVGESRREGLIEEERHGLVAKTLEFSDKRAREVAVDVRSLTTVELGATPADIERLVAKQGFSRYPVRDAAGEIAGYLHLKDILYADDERHEQPIPPKRVRRLATVREDDDVEDVLATMQLTGRPPRARHRRRRGGDGRRLPRGRPRGARRRGHRHDPALTGRRERPPGRQPGSRARASRGMPCRAVRARSRRRG